MGTVFDLDTPVLLVDLNILERNIADMAEIARRTGKALRPHTKTHKTPEIARMQLQAGAVGLTVAKLGEAEALADAGCTDIFVANEIVGAAKITRMLDLMERVNLCIGVDSVAVAEPISIAARERGMTVPVRIEVDTGLGRAGTRSIDEAAGLAKLIVDLPGLELEGIFTHEGHLYRASEPQARYVAAQLVVDQLNELTQALNGQSTPVNVVSVGSTPGAATMAELVGPTELRPGVYVFNDRIQQQLGVSRERCALTVLTTVVSVRPDGKIIVDAGSKSLAGDRLAADTTCGEVLGHDDIAFLGMSEEHGHLQALGSVRIRVGDKLRVIPNHACTCVNQHDTLISFRDETVEEVWAVSGRGKVR